MDREPVQWAWTTVIPYWLVHVGCLGALWTGPTPTAMVVLVASVLTRQFGLTVGYHRYFAHRSFKTSRAGQLALAILGGTGLQGGILWWAETHRRHHRFADTPDDLHSPHHQGFLYAHFGWFADKRHHGTRLEAIPDLARYPELVWLDRYPFAPFVIQAGAMGLGLGVSGIVWGVLIPTVITWEITHFVQSFSHCWRGYRRWSSPDRSRNHWLLGVLALGEYHNNHHRFPGSARQGLAWWEVDMGYCLLKLLAVVGIVWDLRTPSSIDG